MTREEYKSALERVGKLLVKFHEELKAADPVAAEVLTCEVNELCKNSGPLLPFAELEDYTVPRVEFED